MFKGLRNRFLIMHMVIVSLIVFVFFGTILLFNYQNMDNNADMILNDMFTQPPMPNGGGRPPRNDRPFRQGDMRERFAPIFTLELDENKNITNVISMFQLEDTFYKELSVIAFSQKSDVGLVTYDGVSFKYKMNNAKIMFLDISKERQMFMNTVYTFLWIAIPLLLVIFFISLYFANRSIKPIEASYNRQKEFIADASHELKTPLAVISANVDMLLADSSAEQKKWLTYIKKETERMASLTGSLLYLTKLDYVKEKSVESVFDLSKMMNDYLLQLDATFFENNIKTQVDILPDIKIKGDSEQFRRLVGILTDNAVKYTDGIIRIRLERTGNEVALTVYNTGKGISADELPLIWDRFYRGDKSRESAGGFGLGLSIAKGITEKHNGSLTAESVENEWTRFTLKIPPSD